MPKTERAPERAQIEFPIVLADAESIAPSPEFTQDLILAVFGRSYVVVHEPIGDRFRKRAPSRIRAWRAPNA